MKLFLLFVEKSDNNLSLAAGSEFLFSSQPALFPEKESKRRLVKITIEKSFPVPEKEVIIPGIKNLITTEFRNGKEIIVYKFNPAVFLTDFMVFFQKYESLYFKIRNFIKYRKDNAYSNIKKAFEIMEIFDQFMFLSFYNMGYYEVYKLEAFKDTVHYLKEAHKEILEHVEIIKNVLEKEAVDAVKSYS